MGSRSNLVAPRTCCQLRKVSCSLVMDGALIFCKPELHWSIMMSRRHGKLISYQDCRLWIKCFMENMLAKCISDRASALILTSASDIDCWSILNTIDCWSILNTNSLVADVLQTWQAAIWAVGVLGTNKALGFPACPKFHLCSLKHVESTKRKDQTIMVFTLYRPWSSRPCMFRSCKRLITVQSAWLRTNAAYDSEVSESLVSLVKPAKKSSAGVSLNLHSSLKGSWISRLLKATTATKALFLERHELAWADSLAVHPLCQAACQESRNVG